ncbi:MAG: beta-ketoacyl-[acyl-carrier-protein] synthase family protein [Syntrophales bacterium]
MHPDQSPVILGYDAVSPLGVEWEEQWRRALQGESGIGPLTRFPLRKGFPVRVAGQVPGFDETPYPFLKPREMAHWTSPIFRHALLVVHRALRRAGVEVTPELAPRVAVTFSTAVGGLDAVINADRLLVSEGRLPHPFTNANSCVNMVGGKVSILTGATGPICSPITACATGSSSLILGAMFLLQGMADAAICGAVDFALVEPIVAGFATMNGAYRPKEGRPEEDPRAVSRPFSRNRRGFVISEGAGCFILATKDFARAHGIPWRIEVAGWGMTSDAYHFVAPRRETIRHCMAEAVEHAGISSGDVDAVNAHAASTRVGDKVEVEALGDLFGDTIPPVSANKSQIGHAMGASSAIEALLGIEGMLRDTILPTINYDPDPEIVLDCVPGEARRREQEFLLKNAFGFGGCNACLVFKRVA